MANERIGSTFESFLETEGLKDQVYSSSIKRVLAWQLAEAMKTRRISKAEMARQMETSRAQLDRILNPTNNKVQLDTMEKAAKAVGRRLILALE